MTGPRTDVRRRRSGNAGVVVALILLLLAAGGVAYFLTQKSPAATVTMPDLTGKTETAALQKIGTLGIPLKTKVGVTHSTVTVGDVVSTDPKFGAALTRGERVTLTISLGAQTAQITVPSVKNMNVVSAQSELQGKPYLMNVKVQFLQTVPTGITNPGPNVVLSQVPAVGAKAHTGDKITLFVLSPGSQFSVPILAGDTTTQAGQALGQAGLNVGPTTSTVCSNTVPIGLVVSSNPASGTLVNSGDQVTLTTSSGYCKVQVPSVIGETQGQATQTLTNAHFQVSVSPTDPSICSPSQINRVSDQSPSPSSYALYKSNITISICEASTETTTTIPTTTTS